MSVATETPARSEENYRVTRSRRNVAWTGAGALIVVVVLALFPYIVYAGTTTIMVQAFIVLTLASMWNLLAGYAGLVSVGQQAFVGLGAYFVLILALHGTSPFAALPVAAIGCGVAAIPLWWLVSRLRSGYFAIATWVLAATVMLIIEKFSSIGGGTGMPLPGLSGYDPTLLTAYTYWIGLAVTVIALATVYLLLRGRLGLVLTAIRDDEVAARSSGARVGLARMLVFVVAGIGCGAAGAVLAISQLQVQPSAVFSVQWTAEMAFATIIGGLGTIEGPILGTAVYILLQQTLASYNAWYLIILGLVAIAIALFARRGLWGLVDDHLHVRLFPVGYWLWAPGAARPRPLQPAPGAGSQAQLTRARPAGRQNVRVLLAEIAEVSRAVATTSARLAKIETLAAALREAGPLEVPIAVAYLSGELPQRQIGIGWATLRGGFTPAAVPTLTLSEVDSGLAAIGAVSGKGSAAARKALVSELFGRATEDEQRFLYGLLSGELRQGALEGVMTEAVARAASVPVADVRRAVMLRGSLGAVAAAALAGGRDALGAFGLEAGRPVRPMLAASAASIADALAKVGGTGAVEWKLDGIRIQAHLAEGHVRLFTRTLEEITGRVPEVVAVLAKLPVASAVLDGELIALREDGRPLPFQDTAARAASQDAVGPSVPLSVFLFDALQLEGTDLIDLPDEQRHAALARAVPPELLMPRLVTNSAEEATAFFADAIARGHEGVVVKSLDTPYAAGRRGAGWIKVKPRHTLDLVVLAVEWGHGRRRGWLSNLHLGARDPETGGFVMLGKTFKGLTDELLTWQTQRLLELEDRRDSYTVYVRPELVVEIAFDGVQRSPRYPGGLALRFARVLRYREDKTAAEADTIDTVRALGPVP